MTDATLTKLTVNMTDKAMAAINSAADRLGLSRTDTINRAVQAYDVLLAAKPGDVLVFGNPNGPDVTVEIGR